MPPVTTSSMTGDQVAPRAPSRQSGFGSKLLAYSYTRAIAIEGVLLYTSEMRAYSLDLRERVLAAVDRGTPYATVARTLRISERTIARWVARRQTGLPLVGGTGPGRRQGIPDAALPFLRQHLEAQPDATLSDHLAQCNTSHAPVSQSALARAIRRTGWTRKKRRSTPASKTRLPDRPSGSDS
jgi:transposase